MTRSHSLILHVIVLLHTLDPASTSQLKVQASVGGAVLLPCLYSRMDSLKDNAPVFWRDEKNRNVLNIRHKVPEWTTQDPTYSGRVFWEAELYKKGNFSILMSGIRQADGGNYECHIPVIDFQQNVRLSVSVNRGGEGSGASGGGAMVTTTSFVTALLLFSHLIF